MVRFRLFLIVFLSAAFISACGDTEKEYNYKSVDTEGLEVYPKSLIIANGATDGYFTLKYNPSDLVLIEYDDTLIGPEFAVSDTFDVNYCLRGINTHGECRLNIKYTAADNGTRKGELMLIFLYTKDAGSKEYKNHLLKISAEAASNPIVPAP